MTGIRKRSGHESGLLRAPDRRLDEGGRERGAWSHRHPAAEMPVVHRGVGRGIDRNCDARHGRRGFKTVARDCLCAGGAPADPKGAATGYADQ